MQSVAYREEVATKTVYLVPEDDAQRAGSDRSRWPALRRWLSPRRHHGGRVVLCPLRYDPAKCDLVLVRLAGRGTVRAVNGQPVRATKVRGTHFLAFAPAPFEPWENVLWVDPAVREVELHPAFSHRSRVDAALLLGDVPFRLLDIAGGILPSPAAHSRPLAEASPLAFIMRSFNGASGSAFRNTFHACYDLTQRTYRLNSWVWCSAAAVKALLSEWSRRADKSVYQMAERVGKALRERQLTAGPNAGGIEVRWDLDARRGDSYGIVRWLAPNDTAFIASQAFLPLYEATGEAEYLEAARRAASWIRDQGMHGSGRLRAGCDATTGRWDDSWLYVDSMFVAGLFAGLAVLDRDGPWQEVLRSTLDDAVRRFSLPNGLFAKTWRSSGGLDTVKWARGQAWALLGLLDGYGAVPTERWLERAIECANALLGLQNDNGSWNYLMDDPSSGECAKATAILAYNLARLFKATGAAAYQHAAERALSWCQLHIYDGDDSCARGAITSHTAEGCIVGTRDVNCAFLYSAAYYLMARHELADRTTPISRPQVVLASGREGGRDG